MGCLLISEFVVDHGRLSGAKAIQSAVRLTEEDREFGFKGTRTFTPGAEQYYFECGSASELLRYEEELGRTFNLPLSAFCTYSGRRLVDLDLSDLLISLFKPHGQIIGKGLAFARE